MTYDQTVEYLFNQLPVFQVQGAGAYKPGLQTAHILDDAFGNKHRCFKSIHVAGTNGKGSTSHSLASVLMEAGYKVGLYTSPHLVDFRERIRVNGVKISKDFVVDFVERYRNMHLDCAPSFFELTTIMAFDWFAQSKVDYAVIEVGLGGRLDTTNIISPELCIITNVSLDHVALLGDTEAQIAGEKAGIIKPGVPVIISEADGEGVRQVFMKIAESKGAPIVFAQDNPIACVERNGYYWFGLRPGEEPMAECDLQGPWQIKNINGVLAALRVLDKVSYDAIKEGLANIVKSTGLVGRWMTLKEKSPRIICDTGHNIGAWRYLAPRLSKIAEESDLRVVIGFANDKDAEGIFKMLPKQANYYFVEPSVKRARPSTELLSLAADNNLQGQAFDSVEAGYRQAQLDSSSSSTIFVGGSNFVVAEILI